MKNISTIQTRATKIFLVLVLSTAGITAATISALVESHAEPQIAYAADGWQKSGNRWWYKTGNTYAQGWKAIGTERVYDQGVGDYVDEPLWYYFDNNGWMKTSWLKIDGKWYYFNNSGVMQKGYQTIKGKTYYFLEGTYHYCPEGIGSMCIGWRQIGGSYHYFDNSGVMQTDWKKIDGKWYYLDPSNGVMEWNKWIDGYYLTDSGAMATGLTTIYDTKLCNGDYAWHIYYFDSSGVMKTGWVKDNGKWYYFDSAGHMRRNESLNINGNLYSFGADGAMWTGWFNGFVDGRCDWYYADASGCIQKNKWIGNYYVTNSGAMATNAWIGKYHVNASGLWDKTA